MAVLPEVPIPGRIIALMQERNRLFTYPLEALEAEIRQIGFSCSQCGTCCTRMDNRHIFLLDTDVKIIKAIDPAAIRPAPDPEFSDQNGMMYVSGYALRMKDDNGGACWFLQDNRCRIYEKRSAICRIYPHMLRREAGHAKTMEWCIFSRMNEHGRYHEAIPDDECRKLALEIKEYENAFLTHQISFLETIYDYFSAHDLRHDPDMHKRNMQRILQGGPVDVKVFHAGELKDCRIGGASLK
ncbi:MAG: YkgJ family cysteine cluster protein [Methanoregula sp.]